MDDTACTYVSHPLVFITGPAGAGRGTALDKLEDLGFEGIDNLPLSLLPALLERMPLERPLALGIDPRNRDFDVDALSALIDDLRARPGLRFEMVFLDCGVDALLRRFSETRRRHPLRGVTAPADGIEQEKRLLEPVRARADYLIDTTDMTPHDLRADMARWFAPEGTPALAVVVQSFSYKRGVPRAADLVFDCRFLANPHWVTALRALDGRDAAVATHVQRDPRFADIYARIEGLVHALLPAFADEGKSTLTIALGCTGGQHRSVVVTEMLATALAQAGWQVSKRHRELEREAALVPR